MPEVPRKPELPSTQWSLIARLQRGTEVEARAALDELCRAYHYPLYCQIRRHGLSHHDAEDALQEFLLKLLRLDTFGGVDSDKGRLRTFLLVSLRRFLSNWRRDQYRRNRLEVCLETESVTKGAEARFLLDEMAHQESPDRLYDRQWAQELMAQVLGRLRSQYEAKGKVSLFDALHPVLMGSGGSSVYNSEDMAARLGIKPGALRTALHRLKDSFKEELERQILQTTEDRDMAREEFYHLMHIANSV